jgi:hypothetical protein
MAGMSSTKHLEGSMHKRLTGVGVGLAIAFFSSAALPQSRPTATILAAESDNCAAWTLHHAAALRCWVFGYLSGVNAAWGGSYKSPADVLAKVENEEQVISLIDSYCKNNPGHSIQQAAHHVYGELSKK